jgi:L-threonylcarbamoyladenylate synthase
VPDTAAARALAAEWPEAAERLAGAFWPGPLTLVVRAAEGAPAAVAAGGTIAVRPASDAVSRALLAAWGRPLFSTSANRRGEPAPASVEEAIRALAAAPGAGAIQLALAPVTGEEAGGAPARPSTIVDVTSEPRLVRSGAIPVERLRKALPGLA